MKTRFPVGPLFISLASTLLVWGVCLRSSTTLSPEANVTTIRPGCRVSTNQLACAAGTSPRRQYDAASPSWVSIPADYYFRRARLRGEPRPRWNPYVGSGYPIALDGHTARFSPAQWYQSHVPGDQGRDVVLFIRFALWTFAITWLVSVGGASTALQIIVALSATLAPYGALYVDIAFLDVDLLSPWFLLIVYGFATARLSLVRAAALSFALGVTVGVMSFQQAQVALCVAMGVLALAAAPFTRARSLLLVGCLGLGVLAVVPSWLPLLRNLDQFVSSRDVLCIAETGVGSSDFLSGVLEPRLGDDRFAFVTLVGIGLLPFVPPRARFILLALLGLGAWEVLGLPSVACSLPVISGIRFSRHFVPHLQMLFISAVGIAIAALSRRLDKGKPWIILGVAQVAAVLSVHSAVPIAAADWVLRFCFAATGCGVLAVCSYAFAQVARSRWQTSRAMFDVALASFALIPLVFASSIPIHRLDGQLGTPQVPPLPAAIDPATPLGMVQQLSEREDRRHYSPSSFLYPNWAEALGILDLLSVAALYPLGYHELNAELFHGWESDPFHGLIPDRFVPVLGEQAMSREFQRVLAVHRVSLLTFARRGATFAAAPSPYAKKNCRLLARSTVQDTESYVCPAVGPVGYFPSRVSIAPSRADALARLQRLSATELLDIAVLGPELDLSIAGVSDSAEPRPGKGSVRSVRRSGDNLTYQLEVEEAGMFVIADSYFRGWTARINRKRAGISRANVAFKAVQVPAGEVELKLHFSPVVL